MYVIIILVTTDSICNQVSAAEEYLQTCHGLTIAATTTTKNNGANLQLLCIPQGVTRNYCLLCLVVDKYLYCSATGCALLLL